MASRSADFTRYLLCYLEIEKPITFDESKQIAIKGGTIAGNTRKDIEKQLGESIVTSRNAKDSIKELSVGKTIELEDQRLKKNVK